MGAWKLEWASAKWLRLASLLFLLGAFAAFGGMIGGCEGMLRGAENAVIESPVRAEVLEPAARAGAGAIRWIDQVLENKLAGRSSALTEKQNEQLQAFLAGKYEMDLQAFLSRLTQAETKVIEAAMPDAVREIRAEIPLPKNKFVDSLLFMAVEPLLRNTLRSTLTQEAERIGIDSESFFLTLPAAARMEGADDALSIRELSTHVLERVLIPVLVNPLRTLMRAQQLVCVVCIGGSVVLALLGFWIARRTLVPAAVSSKAG